MSTTLLLLFIFGLFQNCLSSLQLEGEWDLEFSSTRDTPKDLEDEFEAQDGSYLAPLTHLFNFTAQDSRLSGLLLSHNSKIIWEWTSSMTGQVRSALLDLESGSEDTTVDTLGYGEESILFNFQLTNRTNGFLVSNGEFLPGSFAPTGGFYQIVFPDNFSFFLSIQVNSEVTEAGAPFVITVTGRKRVKPEEKGFLQKMGTPMMIVAFFMISKLMKAPSASMPQMPQAASASPRTPARVTSTAETTLD